MKTTYRIRTGSQFVNGILTTVHFVVIRDASGEYELAESDGRGGGSLRDVPFMSLTDARAYMARRYPGATERGVGRYAAPKRNPRRPVRRNGGYDPYAPEITYQDVQVVRFLDNAENRRWFMRAHEVLGQFNHVAFGEDHLPVDRKGLLAATLKHFGKDAYAIY